MVDISHFTLWSELLALEVSNPYKKTFIIYYEAHM